MTRIIPVTIRTDNSGSMQTRYFGEVRISGNYWASVVNDPDQNYVRAIMARVAVMGNSWILKNS